MTCECRFHKPVKHYKSSLQGPRAIKLLKMLMPQTWESALLNKPQHSMVLICICWQSRCSLQLNKTRKMRHMIWKIDSLCASMYVMICLMVVYDRILVGMLIQAHGNNSFLKFLSFHLIVWKWFDFLQVSAFISLSDKCS